MKQIIISNVGDREAEMLVARLQESIRGMGNMAGLVFEVSITELHGKRVAAKLESTIEPLVIHVGGLTEVHEAARAVEKLNAALDDTAVKLRALSLKG